MNNKNEQKKQTEDVIKRFSLSKEEREQIEKIRRGMEMIGILGQGLRNSLQIQLLTVQDRVGIKNESPEGHTRQIDFDPATLELLVIDIPKPKEQPQQQTGAKTEESGKGVEQK